MVGQRHVNIGTWLSRGRVVIETWLSIEMVEQS